VRKVKTVLSAGMDKSKAVAKIETASGEPMVLTPATLPFFQSRIDGLRKKNMYIIVVTPGECFHCGRQDDLRLGVCYRCVDECFTDGVFVWHSSDPARQWAIPAIDRVIGRI
jgi:hypothetical protein